jgi:hypothetical protein
VNGGASALIPMAATTARRIDWTGEKKTVEAIDLRAL